MGDTISKEMEKMDFDEAVSAAVMCIERALGGGLDGGQAPFGGPKRDEIEAVVAASKRWAENPGDQDIMEEVQRAQMSLHRRGPAFGLADAAETLAEAVTGEIIPRYISLDHPWYKVFGRPTLSEDRRRDLLADVTTMAACAVAAGVTSAALDGWNGPRVGENSTLAKVHDEARHAARRAAHEYAYARERGYQAWAWKMKFA